MIKKSSEQVTDIRENMRGGTGQVTIKHCFRKDEIRASCRLCAQLELGPGVSIGLHEHLEEDEVFIIQQGKALVIDGGQEVEVEAGDAILTGKGLTHSIKNVGSDTLLVTAIIMPYTN